VDITTLGVDDTVLKAVDVAALVGVAMVSVPVFPLLGVRLGASGCGGGAGQVDGGVDRVVVSASGWPRRSPTSGAR